MFIDKCMIIGVLIGNLVLLELFLWFIVRLRTFIQIYQKFKTDQIHACYLVHMQSAMYLLSG